MTFLELYDLVIVATARPDLVNETITSLQKSAVKMHGLDFWKKDFVERVIAIPENSSQSYFTYQVDIASNMPRMRKMCYMRKWDTVGLAPGMFFSYLDPSAALDSYSLNKNNRVYLAGTTLNIVSTTADLALLVGYYKWPTINPLASFQSWIAEEYPYALIDDAAATIFSMIGKLDEAKLYMKMVNNPGDPMSPGWIQQLFAHNLELGIPYQGQGGNTFYEYVGNPWLSS